MKKFLLSGFLMAALWPLIAQPVSEDLPGITGCIALVNATVVTAPGKTPETATVIVRDGVITQIGNGIVIPPDAYKVVADSLFVYPAFIDAFSSVGIKEPERPQGGGQAAGQRPQRPAVDEDGNPSLEDAGITPFIGVRPTFDPKDKSVSDWRAQGFAVAHVVPRGRMMPGKGALIVLSGQKKDEVIWKEDVSLFSQFSGAGGAYPATVIGVLAKWREVYHNAEILAAHQATFERNTMVARPKYNKAHEALLPVVQGKLPVFFRAPKIKDISRALELQKDLGMKMVIADAEQAWELTNKFTSGNIPIVLSLKLPEDKGEKKSKSDAGGKGGVEDKPASTEDVKSDPEKEALEMRRTESLLAHRSQAGKLEKAGVPFSFGTMSAKPGDFAGNIRLMMEYGLSFDKALSALTTQPAKLLGIEKYCGTIEAGKMANMIVSTKPLFDKGAAIRYMVVEGQLYSYEVKERKKSPEGDGATSKLDLPGTWSYEIEAPDQSRPGRFIFREENGEIKGGITDEASGSSATRELDHIVVDGNTVSFSFMWEMSGQGVKLEFDLDVSGDEFKGTVTVGAFGSFPITGARISRPE
jgi:imidazolonepropionase-like amidohydrolase